MEGAVNGVDDQAQPQCQQLEPLGNVNTVERLNPVVQQQLNLESLKIRAISLFKAISRILEGFDVLARTSSVPKWQDILGQFSMVNLELFNIVEDLKKVSKAFVVYPKNIDAQNSTILPVMLSTKLLPEMEMEDSSKREQLLHGMQNLPLPNQIDKLKARIEMIGAACESAEKVLAETRKAYCFGGRQGPAIVVMDKVQAAKIHEQENLLRAAVNLGEGLRVSADQKQIPQSLPMHLVDVLPSSDGIQVSGDASGMYLRNTPPMSSNNVNVQGTLLQASGSQLVGRTGASRAATTSSPFESTSASPVPYANSPRSGSNITNASSPQQQAHHHQQQQLQQQQQQQLQQHQRQKILQLPQQQQILSQQQFRQTSLEVLGQALQGHMQFSQPLGHQQFQARHLSSGHVGQNQLNPGNQMNRNLGQLSGNTNGTLFGAHATQNSQMIPNVQAAMTSQTLMPRMQYGMPANNMQRSHGTQQIVGDQMFNVNAGNAMPPIQQQQQHQQQHALGNLPQQNLLPPSLAAFQQQRQQLLQQQQQQQQNQQ